MFATATSVRGSSDARMSARDACTSTSFASAFARVASTAASSESRAMTGAKPSFAAAIERTPGATAEVDHAAALELHQELDALLSRRVGAGAERTPGFDHDRHGIGRRVDPRRADPQRPDLNRPVERLPAFAPVGCDVIPARAAEDVPEPLLASGVGVGDELDALARVDLLKSLGEELEHARTCLFDAVGGDGDRDAPQRCQRNALFSLSRKPSLASYVSSPASRSKSSSSCLCSSLNRRGTVTFTSTRGLPRPKPCSTGKPRPRNTTISPGCVPGSKVSSVSPWSVGTLTVAPSAACVIVRSTVV